MQKVAILRQANLPNFDALFPFQNAVIILLRIPRCMFCFHPFLTFGGVISEKKKECDMEELFWVDDKGKRQERKRTAAASKGIF
jgi:hypothetical protein